MQLSEVKYPEGLPVDGYGPGFFRLAGQVQEGPMTVFAGKVGCWQGWTDTGWLDEARGAIDLLLLGTGAEMLPVDKTLRSEVEAAGIALEQMPTPSACRTYNVLLAEGRRVGLAAFPV